MNNRHNGQVRAVVTGGTSGIGLAAAHALAERDIHVIATGRRVANGEGHNLRAHSNIEFFRMDVTNPDDVNALKERVTVLGGMKYLVNSVGTTEGDSIFAKLTMEGLRHIMEVNFFGPAAVMIALRSFLRSSAGVIVNIASIVGGIKPHVGQPAYAASKAALCAITEVIALEEGRKGVRANSVLPGYIDTEMTANLSPKMRETAEEDIALRHEIGQPQDVASVIDWLCSDKSQYVTGGRFPVDGGLALA